MKTSERVPWLLILAVAAFSLRAWGIGWGLPEQGRAWSYHPDESQVLIAALGLDPLAGRLDSEFYNYGQGYLLLVGTLTHLLERIGLLAPIAIGAPPPPLTLLIARLITALLGTLSCVWVHQSGTRLYGIRAGWIAAIAMAASPLAAQHSHFATVDIPATAAICGSLAFVARFVDAPRARWLIAAGFAAGFAGAVKYNAGLVVLSAIAAWWSHRPRRAMPLAGCVLATATGFLFGCPGAVINPARFREDLLFEAAHMGSGSENLFLGTAPGWIHHALVNLPWALGPVLALCVPFALTACAVRRRGADLTLAAFAIPYFLLIGSAQVKFARYLLPLLPILCLWLGAWVGDSPARTNMRQSRFAGGALRAGLAMSFLLTLAIVSVFSRPDPRDQAARHLRSSGAERVAFARRPWYWSPPLTPGLAHFSPVAAWRSAMSWEGTPQLAAPDLADEWSVEFLDNSGADAVVISEFESEDSVRLGEARVLRYLDSLPDRFPRKTIFANPPAIGPLVFLKGVERHGLAFQPLPHDMTYANPITVVYQK